MKELKKLIETQKTELLIETLDKIENSAEIKTLRSGEKVKVFSDESKLIRAVIYDIIECREGEKYADNMFDHYATF